MGTIDLHQHVWPERFVEVLTARTAPPRLRGQLLEVPGEEAREVDADALRPGPRLELLDRFQIDVAVVSLSPLLGIGELGRGEGEELVAAYEDGIRAVARETGGRIVGLSAGGSLDGFAGACVGARRLRDLETLAPLLDELEQRHAFLFVHPSPAEVRVGAPSWWIPVVEYSAQLQAAYATWLAEGVRRWPGLDVVFASLAGGGPVQLERLLAFGVGVREVLSEHVFFETSSYGRRALELCLATFGVEQVVFGSDAPILDPEQGLNAVRAFGDAVADSLCVHNPRRLLP